MTKRFVDIYVSTDSLFSLGRDTASGAPYVAIPVSNRLADYEEYYRLSEIEFDTFLGSLDAALDLVESCRNRERDDRLILHPGSDRGVPRRPKKESAA